MTNCLWHSIPGGEYYSLNSLGGDVIPASLLLGQSVVPLFHMISTNTNTNINTYENTNTQIPGGE